MNATIERIWTEPSLDGAWVEAVLPAGCVKLYRTAAGAVTVGHGESVEAWADDDVLGWVDECMQADLPMWKVAAAVEAAVAEGLRSDRLLRALLAVCERADPHRQGIHWPDPVAWDGRPLVEQAAELVAITDDVELRAALAERGVQC